MVGLSLSLNTGFVVEMCEVMWLLLSTAWLFSKCIIFTPCASCQVCVTALELLKCLLDASCYNGSMSFITLHTTTHHPEATSSTPFPKLAGLAQRWEIMFWQSVHGCVPDTWGILGRKTTKFFSTFPWAAQMFGWWLQSPNHITA